MSTAHRIARLLSGAVIAALTIGLAAPGVAAAGAVAPASPVVAPTALHGAGSCPDIDMVYRARSEFPATSKGIVDHTMQRSRMEKAVLCLVNAERSAVRLPPVKIFFYGRFTPDDGRLLPVAKRHLADSLRLRWWGKVEPGKNCVPVKNQPDKCDGHINPETGTTAQKRLENYSKRCGESATGENLYTAYGLESLVTPRAAVQWWMNSPGHRDNILRPDFTDMALAVRDGSADPAAGSTTPSATYVQVFGFCRPTGG